jgi:hypothetical protein
MIQTTQPCFQTHRTVSYFHMMNKAYNALKENKQLVLVSLSKRRFCQHRHAHRKQRQPNFQVVTEIENI